MIIINTILPPSIVVFGPVQRGNAAFYLSPLRLSQQKNQFFAENK